MKEVMAEKETRPGYPDFVKFREASREKLEGKMMAEAETHARRARRSAMRLLWTRAMRPVSVSRIECSE